MGKVKIKKSDIWIDMTPMSDVMTLLLTFFIDVYKRQSLSSTIQDTECQEADCGPSGSVKVLHRQY